MKIGIKIGLWVVVAVLSFLVYQSIAGKIEFEEQTHDRRSAVIQNLKDIRTAQMAYKSVNDRYAKDFEQLLDFVKHDSFPMIKAEGMVPDTMSESQAVLLGLVTRDTSYVSVKDSIFSPRYLRDHLMAFYIDSLPYIPFGNGVKFDFNAGFVEKGKVRVSVFAVFAAFEHVYRGIDTSNEAIDLGEGLQVGSMEDPSTSGNWGE
ncbi:MAG TPA: hypothetical protein EYN69_07295 [Flavobacteriales bacterium]|nr:hypothetical protein [Flavobacteriales bacterium]